MWFQRQIQLNAMPRGFHLITQVIVEALPELVQYNLGLLNLFLMHTSASLTINENSDPDVRRDLEAHFNEMVPENLHYYEHTIEGPDDIPAHIKSCMIGQSVMLPITSGKLALGQWQGIYLCEHRNLAPGRKIIATISGQN